MEYSQQATSPYIRRDIGLMELIQRLATRMVKGKRELQYEHRRLRGDLILAYNIFNGRLDFPQAEFFDVPSERDLRGHDFKLNCVD